MTTSRRTLLCAGFGATAALASRSDLASAQVEPCGASLLSGVTCDANVRAAAAEDYGRIVRGDPWAVAKPTSGAEIADLVRWAAKRDRKVAARGQGHSTYGRSLAESGVVIDMSAVSAIEPAQSDRIVVGAGATWRRVLDATLAQGLTPPVLTNYLDLSVGGTLAVGGIGGSSSRHGMQTDQVLALDVVTGEGETLTCSANAHPHLFDAVRAGLAQCAVITRATLRLVHAPERVRRFQLFYPDLPSLTADQRRVLADERFDQLQGAILPDGAGGWRYQLDGAVFYDSPKAPDDDGLLAGLSFDPRATVISDLTYRDDAQAFDKFAELLRSKGQWSNPKPWLLTFLRGSNAEGIARQTLASLDGDAIGPFGRLTYYPMRAAELRTPLLRRPDEEFVSPFNLIRMPTWSDAAKAQHAVAHNRILYDRIRAAGGVQYPVSAVPMSRDDWREHFGSRWPLLLEGKQRYDPANVLTPGYNLF